MARIPIQIFITETGSQLFSKIGSQMRKVSDAIAGVNRSATDSASTVSRSLEGFAAESQAFAEKITSEVGKIELIASELGKVASSAEQAKAKMTDFNKTIEIGGRPVVLGELAVSAESIRKSVVDLSDQLDASVTRLSPTTRKIAQTIGRAFGTLQARLALAKKSVSDVSTTLEASTKSVEKAAESASSLSAAYVNASRSARELIRESRGAVGKLAAASTPTSDTRVPAHIRMETDPEYRKTMFPAYQRAVETIKRHIEEFDELIAARGSDKRAMAEEAALRGIEIAQVDQLTQKIQGLVQAKGESVATAQAEARAVAASTTEVTASAIAAAQSTQQLAYAFSDLARQGAEARARLLPIAKEMLGVTDTQRRLATNIAKAAEAFTELSIKSSLPIEDLEGLLRRMALLSSYAGEITPTALDKLTASIERVVNALGEEIDAGIHGIATAEQYDVQMQRDVAANMKLQASLLSLAENMSKYREAVRHATIDATELTAAGLRMNEIAKNGSPFIAELATSIQSASAEQRRGASSLYLMAEGLENIGTTLGPGAVSAIGNVAFQMRQMAADASSIVPASFDRIRASMSTLLGALVQLGEEWRAQLGSVPEDQAKGIKYVTRVYDDATKTVLEYMQTIDRLEESMQRTNKVATRSELPDHLREMQNEARLSRLEWRKWSSVFQGVLMGMAAGNGQIRQLVFGLVFMGFGVKRVVFQWMAFTAAVTLAANIVKGAVRAFTGAAKTLTQVGLEADKLMNKLRPLVQTTRDMGRAWDYAQAKGVKFGLPLEDVANAMETLTRAGLGTEEMLEAVLLGAVATGKTGAEFAQVFTNAIGEEKENLKELLEVGVNVNTNLIDVTNRAAVAEAARQSVIEQLMPAYRDVAQSATKSLDRIKLGWKAIWSYMAAPVVQKVFVPILKYISQFVASLAGLARGLAFSEATQRHLNKTMAIFYDTIKEYAPELRLIANFIRGLLVGAFNLMLRVVRALVVGFRFLLEVVRRLSPLFQRLGRVAKGVRDIFYTLFPKGLATQLRLWWSDLKEAVMNLWEPLMDEWSRFKDAVHLFFTTHPVGIAVAAAFEWAWDKIKAGWEWTSGKLVEWWENEVGPWAEESPLKAVVIGVGLSILLKKALGKFITVAIPALAGRSFLTLGGALSAVWGVLKGTIAAAAFAYTVYAVVDFVISTTAPKKVQEWWDRQSDAIDTWIKEHPFYAIVTPYIVFRTIHQWKPVILPDLKKLGSLIAEAFGKIATALGSQAGTQILTALGGALLGGLGAIAYLLLLGLASELINGIPVLSDSANSLVEYGLWPAFQTFAARFGQVILTAFKGVLGAIELGFEGLMRALEEQSPAWLKKILGITEEKVDIHWFDGLYEGIDKSIASLEEELTGLKVKWADKKVNEVELKLGIDPSGGHETVEKFLNEVEIKGKKLEELPIGIKFSEYGVPIWDELDKLERRAAELKNIPISIEYKGPTEITALPGIDRWGIDLATLQMEEIATSATTIFGTDLPDSFGTAKTSWEEFYNTYSAQSAAIVLDTETNLASFEARWQKAMSTIGPSWKSFCEGLGSSLTTFVEGPLREAINAIVALGKTIAGLPEEKVIRVRAEIDDEIESHSPSQLEVGLRGIADAIRLVNAQEVEVGSRLQSPMLSTGRGATAITVNVNVTGNTVVGTAQANELADITADRIMRRLLGKVPVASIR